MKKDTKRTVSVKNFLFFKFPMPLFTFLILLPFSPLIYGQTGTLDPSFDGDGIATFSFPQSNENQINAVTVGAGDKVIAAGYAKCVVPSGNYCFAVARYLSNGALDTSFNAAGYSRAWASGSSIAYAAAVQPDQKVVLAGETIINGVKNFAIVRYTEAGALDTTFSDDGIQTINFGGCYSCYALSTAVQPDGKIIVAGELTQNPNQSPNDVDFAVVRLNPDGSRDLSFDGDGRATTSLGTGQFSGDHVKTVLLQTDGKIIVGGNVNYGYGLVRYTATGSLDPSFGTGGKAIFDQNNSGGYTNTMKDFAFQDDNIVAAGNSVYEQPFVVRIDKNGMPDTGFANSVTSKTGRPRDVAVTQQGNIVIAGLHDEGQTIGVLAACFRSYGGLNSQFGSGGEMVQSFNSNPISAANSIAIQSDGKLIVAGYAGSISPFDIKFAVARYSMSGL